ncbi:hypothetical protein [Sphingomonas sp. SUN039]|uniref:hypothetical protein n=1 Tax=Sphingomonas sp. SUN039 TaxID=2937787 RepID=UPI0021644F9E|nr:hypothetical protein [Sphingomonas sp. SUN039]UVO54197.1 hypothetical protein M0209_08710 [Sphingomonas sp. SUN039]
MIRFFFPLALLSPAVAFAQTPECKGGVDLGGQEYTVDLAVGRVKPGAARVLFRRDPDCADAAPGCRQSAYVVPGDEVIVKHLAATRACAVFLSPKGRDTAGWLPRAALSVAPAATVPLSAWVGEWGQIEASITIKALSGGRLKISGEATYGALDPQRVKIGAIHTGEIAAVAKPEANGLSFAMGDDATLPYRSAGLYDCAVKMQRVGRWLLVDDNNNCGGMNVAFRGIYERARRK